MIKEGNGVVLDIPNIVKPLISERAQTTLSKVRHFLETEVAPGQKEYHRFVNSAEKRWAEYPPIAETLKAKAKEQGLFNLFLPKSYNEGAGFTNVEYGLMAEQMGRYGQIGAEVFNCSAPDTGNMEVFAKYANDAQKKRWLEPLLRGEIRSAFCMTEKGVASSDARNIGISMVAQGNHWIINGTKWWSSGAGDPRCKVLLVMGKTSPNNPNPYRQQSIVIVPMDTPGVTVIRPLSVMGYDDAPHGHMEVKFDNVRVPYENVVLGEGRGFEIIQGRLGPGRIHHCMRTLGAAAEALSRMVERAKTRKTFGKALVEHGTIGTWIAQSRIEIYEARLLVLAAAHEMDTKGPKGALELIAMAKIRVPSMALQVIDRAMQTFGAEGLCQDQPLAEMWAHVRTLRLADGPDEVHLHQLARITASKL